MIFITKRISDNTAHNDHNQSITIQKLDESFEYQHPLDNVPAQTVAIEEEPLDSNTSDTTRIVWTISRNHVFKLFA
jgi:hypothetical protein